MRKIILMGYAVCLVLAGCGNSLSGTYVQSDSKFKLTFDGSSVFFGDKSEGPTKEHKYTREGKTLKIAIVPVSAIGVSGLKSESMGFISATVGDDGSIAIDDEPTKKFFKQ